MDLCGTWCTPGQVLEDSTTSSDIKHDFINFYYRAPNKLMLVCMGISIPCGKIQHADHILHILCQLTLSEVNPTQILLIFVSMQHCRKNQEQEKLF